MSPSEKLGSEIVPFDNGATATASRIRNLLDCVKAESPVTLLGACLIRELAAELTVRRRKCKSPISPTRLALALRKVVWASRSLMPGSITPEGKILEMFEDKEPSSGTPKALPNAVAAKFARRKLAEASLAINKIEAILTSSELAMFVSTRSRLCTMPASRWPHGAQTTTQNAPTPALAGRRPPRSHRPSLLNGA